MIEKTWVQAEGWAFAAAYEEQTGAAPTRIELAFIKTPEDGPAHG